MDIESLLGGDRIVKMRTVSSKKKLLQIVSERASEVLYASALDILALLTEREQLGSTGVGNGVAIPHARMLGISAVSGVFVKLDTPVAFDAVDGAPVDLIFMLMAPDGTGTDHIKALALVSRILRNPANCAALRRANSIDEIREILIDGQ